MRNDQVVVLEADGSRRTIPLTEAGLSIGRRSDKDLVLNYSEVSREHARISFEGGNYIITDLGSGNGTYLGQIRLSPHQPRIWRPGQVVRIGPSELRLEMDLTSTPPEIPTRQTDKSKTGQETVTVLESSSGRKFQQDRKPTAFEISEGDQTMVEEASTFSSRLEATEIEVGEVGRVIIQNHNSKTQAFTLFFQDPKKALRFNPPSWEFQAGPEGKVIAEFRASPRRPNWLGGSRRYPISAYLTTDRGESQSHQGYVIARSSAWPLIIVGLLLLLLGGLAVGGGYWRMAVAPRQTEQARMAVSPSPTATTPSIPTATLPPESESLQAGSGEAIEEATATSTPTPQAEVVLPSPSATPPQIPTVTRRPTETPTSPPATSTPTRSFTSTSTRPPTATRMPTATAAPTRASVGPTPIPFQSTESVDQLGEQPIIDVAINPKNPAEVYAVVGGVGIYKSVKGGEGPWAKASLDAGSVTGLVIDPTNPARLLAPTWNAVLLSTDGGNSWKVGANGLSTANRVVDVVSIHPTNPDILYAGIGSTLVVSFDGGQNWTSQGYGEGLTGGRLTSIAVDPFKPDIILVGGMFGSIYKSVDSARTFQQLAYNTGEGTYDITAHPTEPDIYLAGINSYQAGIIRTENGADFQSVSNGLVFGGADSAYCAITYAPGNPQIIYAGSGYEDDRFAKGIFKSVDGGKSWQKISQGLSVNPATGQPHYIKAIAVHPTNPDVAWAATGGGLYKTANGGATWELK